MIHNYSSSTAKKMAGIEQFKIAFQFVLVSIFSVIIGALTCSRCSERLYLLTDDIISAHFNSTFQEYDTAKDFLLSVLKLSGPDIFFITLIFFASFSFLNYLVTDVSLGTYGFCCGFSISFLSEHLIYKTLSNNVAILEFIIYAVFCLFALIIILSYSYRAAIFSLAIHLKNYNGRFSVSQIRLLPFLALTIAYVGAIFIVNGVYCWLIHIIK